MRFTLKNHRYWLSQDETHAEEEDISREQRETDKRSELTADLMQRGVEEKPMTLRQRIPEVLTAMSIGR
jgi:hypothetical protein